MEGLDVPSLAGPPVIGGVLYPPDKRCEALLADFAAELAGRGFKVGGLLQKTDSDDMALYKVGDSGRQSIKQDLGSGSSACKLDSTALAEASGVLREAVADGVDLLMVNKYSHQEKAGGGFAAEMLSAMVAGVPLLTSVPAALVADWDAFTGGRGVVLPPTGQALWRWWGPGRLYQDLALGVADVPVGRVVVGLNFTLVEGPFGIGLAQTPGRATPRCVASPGRELGPNPSLRDLASLVRSWDPFDLALGVAACNAHYNRFDLEAENVNGLDVLKDETGVVVVGGFPGINERLPGCRVIEKSPQPGQYPDTAAQWLLPAAEAAVITSSALANRTLPGLLSLAAHARVALVGPGAPLTPRLFDYGIEILSGTVVTDPEGLVRAVAEGGNVRDIRRHCRQATLRRAGE